MTKPETITELPEIFRYLDHRLFLADTTQALRRRGTFNLRDFAAKAGLKSPGFLKMITDGRRHMTAKTARKFSKALALKGREEKYFVSLVLYNQSDDPDEKNRRFEEINRLRPRSSHFVAEKKHGRYFSRHHYVCIREMVALPDFREDYKWIAKRCFPAISPTEAREAVKTLTELGLLKRDGEGRLAQIEDFIRTQDRQAEEVVTYHFHESVLDKARHALGMLKPEERNYYALTIPLTKAQYEEIIGDFYAFRDRIVEKVQKGPRDFNEVYQINFQLFPATRKRSAGGDESL